MMHSFMKLPDNTEIVHSDILYFGDRQQVKVYIETPCKDDFKNITCWLPDYNWEKNNGYTYLEEEYLHQLVFSLKDIIMDLAKTGGINNDAENI